jgi:uncharacterized protein YgfB (UPF0149 family)
MKAAATRRAPLSTAQVIADLAALTQSIQLDLRDLADQATELSERIEHVRSLVQIVGRPPPPEEK